MAHDVLEFELKLQAGADFELPELASIPGIGSVGPPVRQQLVADYFDTEDLRLARDGITLRRRAGGSDDGWHLKLPRGGVAKDGAVARDELQLPLLATDSVPSRFQELLTARLRGTALQWVATLTTERTVRVLLAPDGTELAEVTDDHVGVRRRDDAALRFREVEVEDRAAGRQLLAAVRATLIAAGAVAEQPRPKLVQALGTVALAPPEVSRPAPVRRRDPAAAAVTATIRSHTRAFLDHDVAVRRHQPDAIHQLRVTCRRLRSDLRTFRPLVERSWADALRSELQWLGSVLGAARDAEVLAERLLGLVAGLPEEAGREPADRVLRAAMTARMATTETAVHDALSSQRYLGLLDALVGAAAAPRCTELAAAPCRDVLPPLVRSAWRRLDRAAAQALRPGAPDEDLHAARIAAKRARYATEAVVPAFGKTAARSARPAEAMQGRLGEQHDAVVAAQTLRELAATPRVGRAAFGLGVLYDRELMAARACADAFRALWPMKGWRRHRSWLGTRNGPAA